VSDDIRCKNKNKKKPWAAKRVVRSWTVRLYAISMRTPLLTFSCTRARLYYSIRLCPPLLPRKKSMQLYWSRPRETTSRHYHAALLPFERLATTRSLVLALLSRCCRRRKREASVVASNQRATAPSFLFFLFPRQVTQTYRCKAGKLGKDTAA
jgi:hypothetical protein